MCKSKINKLVLFVLLLLISIVANAQSTNPRILYSGTGECCPYLNSIKLLSIDPTQNLFGIILQATTPNQGELLNKELLFNGNNIDIQACYWEIDATFATTFIDTFLIDLVQNLEYNLSVYLYISASNVECTKYDSTKIAVKFTTDSTISVTNIINRSKKAIIPNPFSNYILIQNYDFPIFIEVFDVSGNKLIEKKTNEELLDLHYLKNGIYILRINNDYFKILKQ